MRAAPLALVAVCIFSAPAVVLAQSAQEKADAEALFFAAKSALASGNFGEACPKFAESQRKDPAIGTALYLAECYERSGKVASAWAEFHQAEDMANQRHDARAAIAKTRADRLMPSKLSIVLAPGADIPGLEVRRDGETVANAQLGLASPIDGGRHRVIANAPGRVPYEWAGEIAEQRAMMTVTIPKLEESHAATPIASATTTATTPIPIVTSTTIAPLTSTSVAPDASDKAGGMSGGKIAGLVIGGAGLVALGIGTTLGIVAKGNYDGTATQFGCNNNGCPTQAGVDARNSAKGLADASTGIFIGGAIALVGGVVIFLVMPSSHKVTPVAFANGGGLFFNF